MATHVRAYRCTGDGRTTFLGDIDATGISITQRLGVDTGHVTVDWETLSQNAHDGLPMILSWSTQLWIESDQLPSGVMLGGFVDTFTPGETTTLPLVGLGGYPAGQPWRGEDWYGVDVDPADVFTRIWRWLQDQPGGDLGIRINDYTTGVLIGKELEEVEFTTSTGETVSFDAGPVKLATGLTDDLGKKLEEMVAEGGFDWRVETRTDPQGHLAHTLIFGEGGAPRAGKTSQRRLVLDEDIVLLPEVSDTPEYASHVLVVGEGEGKDAVRALTTRPQPGRVTRCLTINDTTLKNPKQAAQRGEEEMAARYGDAIITRFAINDLDDINLGDAVFVQADLPWGNVAQWVRVSEITFQPADPTPFTLECTTVLDVERIRTDIATLPPAVKLDPVLPAGREVLAGQYMYNPTSGHRLSVQRDGNVVLYNSRNTAIWALNTTTVKRLYLMASEGDLRAFNAADQVVWAAGTNTAASMSVQKDGNLVIYNKAGTPIWQTNTVGK